MIRKQNSQTECYKPACGGQHSYALPVTLEYYGFDNEKCEPRCVTCDFPHQILKRSPSMGPYCEQQQLLAYVSCLEREDEYGYKALPCPKG
jgi:hypothetical protein